MTEDDVRTRPRLRWRDAFALVLLPVFLFLVVVFRSVAIEGEPLSAAVGGSVGATVILMATFGYVALVFWAAHSGVRAQKAKDDRSHEK